MSQWGRDEIYPLVILHTYGKSLFPIEASTISMAIFHSKLLVITRGYIPKKSIQPAFSYGFPMLVLWYPEATQISYLHPAMTGKLLHCCLSWESINLSALRGAPRISDANHGAGIFTCKTGWYVKVDVGKYTLHIFTWSIWVIHFPVFEHVWGPHC